MNKRFINLLSWKVRFYLLIRARILVWSVVWAISCALAIGLWQTNRRQMNESADALALMNNRCKPLTAMQAENRRMAIQLSELQSHQSLLARLQDEQIPFRMIGLVGHGISKCDGDIRVENLKLICRPVELREQSGQAAVAVSTTQRKPDAREMTTLTLSGIAADNIAVSRFVAALRDSGAFRTVDLKSSVGALIDTKRAQSYLVECTY